MLGLSQLSQGWNLACSVSAKEQPVSLALKWSQASQFLHQEILTKYASSNSKEFSSLLNQTMPWQIGTFKQNAAS